MHPDPRHPQPDLPTVPLARGGPITDAMLAEIVGNLANIPTGVTMDSTIVHALVLPCLRELQQRRTAMAAIASMTRPGNVVFFTPGPAA